MFDQTKIPFRQNLYYIEASLLICNANQWTGFYMKQVFTERCFSTDCSNIHVYTAISSKFI